MAAYAVSASPTVVALPSVHLRGAPDPPALFL